MRLFVWPILNEFSYYLQVQKYQKSVSIKCRSEILNVFLHIFDSKWLTVQLWCSWFFLQSPKSSDVMLDLLKYFSLRWLKIELFWIFFSSFQAGKLSRKVKLFESFSDLSSQFLSKFAMFVESLHIYIIYIIYHIAPKPPIHMLLILTNTPVHFSAILHFPTCSYTPSPLLVRPLIVRISL